jgi:hypothetical protein
MRNIFFIAGLAGMLLASCSSGSKKIIVYTNNDAVINEEAKTITQKNTDGHVEKNISYSGDDKITINMKLLSGEQNVDVPGAGYYIVNAKAKDTIIGGFQKYSTPEDANRVMTQEELAHNIDSLKQMITGANTNTANRSFFILPYTAAKITDNEDAHIVGPYHRMTSIEKVGDKEPEVYRFYSIKEVRETIGKLEKLTGAKPAEEEEKKE